MKNIVLIGMPGCGKSTIAKILGEKLDKEVVEMDEYIQEKYKMTIKEMFDVNEDYFRDKETNVAEEISKTNDKIISTGGGIVTRKENIKYLKRNGIIIFINRPLENIISDIDSSTRPLLKDGKERLYKLYNERYELYKTYCDIEIINDKTLNLIINDMLDIVKNERWA